MSSWKGVQPNHFTGWANAKEVEEDEEVSESSEDEEPALLLGVDGG